MKINRDSKYWKWGLTAFAVIAAGVCFFYLIFHTAALKVAADEFFGIIMPILFGLCIAYLMTPILNFIERVVLYPLADKLKIADSPKRKKMIRGISIILTSVFVIAIIYLVFYMLISQIVPSIQSIITNADRYLLNLEVWIQNFLEKNPAIGTYASNIFNQYSQELENWLNGTALDHALTLLKSFSTGIITTLNILWEFIIGFIISIYVLSGKEQFAGQAKKIIYAAFERDTANRMIRNFRFTHRTFVGFLGGKILDSLIIGILCFIGTLILKTPYAALVSVIIGITNIIPFFGPFLGAIPSAILVFVVDPLHPLNCVYFILFIVILQQFDGNILGPKILGNSTGLSSFWVIFSITLFGGIFGIPGMIIGVPTFAVIYAAIRAVINTALEKKELSPKTEEYIKLDYVDEDGTYHHETEGTKEVKDIKVRNKKEEIKKESDKKSEEKAEEKAEEKGE